MTGFFTDPALKADDIHRIVGRPAAVAAPAVLPERLALQPKATLEKLDADVLLLQEVNRDCDRSGRRDVAADLAAALGMNWIFAGEFQEIGEGRRAVLRCTASRS